MPDNVTRLPGAPMTPTEPPDERVIEALELVLERARRGEVQGILCAYVYRNGSTGAAVAGTQTYSMVGRAYALAAMSGKFLEED